MALNFAGYVSDITGAAINNATVEAWVVGGGAAAYSTTSDVNGYWNFDAVTDNQYYIKVIYGGVTRIIDGRSEIQINELQVRSVAEVKGILTASGGLTGTTGAFSGQVTSTLATGTSPFSITSTTVNTNLNADTVDGSHASAFAVAAKGVTNGDTHDHSGGDGAQVDHGGLAGLADDDHTQYVLKSGNITQITTRSHTSLSDIGTNTHSTIDTHIAATSAHGASGNILGATTAAATYAPIAKGVTNGDSHDHSGGDGAAVAGLADGAVSTTAKLANDVVDITKIGNKVPGFSGRRGGAATDWSTPGTTDYTTTISPRIEAGVVTFTIPNGGYTGTATVTFPVAFSYAPVMTFGIYGGGSLPSSSNLSSPVLTSQTASGFAVTIYSQAPGGAGGDNYYLNWVAIGPE